VAYNQITICEPTGSQEPFCLMPTGTIFGDFEIFKFVPSMYFVKAETRGFEIQEDRDE